MKRRVPTQREGGRTQGMLFPFLIRRRPLCSKTFNSTVSPMMNISSSTGKMGIENRGLSKKINGTGSRPMANGIRPSRGGSPFKVLAELVLVQTLTVPADLS